MEDYKGGLKGYWRRRAYSRIDGRRRLARAELGDGRRRRRFWRIRIKPKLKVLRGFSLRRFFSRIRDGYVRMMLRLASSGGGYGVGGVEAFALPRFKEYDEKMLVEIYKSLVARAAAAGGAAGDVPLALRR